MNHHTPLPATAEPAGAVPHSDAEKMRVDCASLALSLRRLSNEDRASSREQSAAGKHVSAFYFHQSARRKISDALWYWIRSRNT